MLTALILALALVPVPSVAPVCPVDGLVEYSQSYGIRHHRGGIHRGIDVYAEKGTPVVAPVDGIVTLGDSKKGGLTATLYLPGPTRYYFAHLDTVKVLNPSLSFGDAWLVDAGTQIGTVGNSGNAKRTSPHLHFGKYIGSRSRNPIGILRESC